MYSADQNRLNRRTANFGLISALALILTLALPHLFAIPTAIAFLVFAALAVRTYRQRSNRYQITKFNLLLNSTTLPLFAIRSVEFSPHITSTVILLASKRRIVISCLSPLDTIAFTDQLSRAVKKAQKR